MKRLIQAAEGVRSKAASNHSYTGHHAEPDRIRGLLTMPSLVLGYKLSARPAKEAIEMRRGIREPFRKGIFIKRFAGKDIPTQKSANKGLKGFGNDSILPGIRLREDLS